MLESVSSIRDKPGLEAGLVFGQVKRDQLAHFLVAQPVGGKQAVRALEVVAFQIDQHVGIRHEHLVLEKRPVPVARRREKLVVVGGDAFGCGHGRLMREVMKMQVMERQALGGKLYPYFHALDFMTERHPTPDKEQIALLAPFDRLDLPQIQLVATAQQAIRALEELDGVTALGFDTESKPTFMKNEASTGPHIVQLSTLERAYIFQLEDAECRRAIALLLETDRVVKAGFGLGDDRRRIIHKLGVDPRGVLDLNAVFRERGYRKDMGVRGAVAVMFNRRFIKSRKATTSNWANVHLQESQLIYAANDAYAALRVYQALGLD